MLLRNIIRSLSWFELNALLNTATTSCIRDSRFFVPSCMRINLLTKALIACVSQWVRETFSGKLMLSLNSLICRDGTTVLECSGLGMDRPLDFIEGSISNHLSEHPFFDSHRLANSR